MKSSSPIWALAVVLLVAALLLVLIQASPKRNAAGDASSSTSLPSSAYSSLSETADAGRYLGGEPTVAAEPAVPVKQEEPEPRVTFHSDKISIQTAAQGVCEQVGFAYDWPRSYKNTQPDCKRYIRVNLMDVPLQQALDAIVVKNGLKYRIEGKHVWLER